MIVYRQHTCETMRTITVLLLYSYCLHTFMVGAYDLRDITDSVFGNSDNSFLPAAFGDFNSDKLTDIIVLKKERKSVAVLLASEQNVVSIDSGPMFQEQSTMECPCPDGEFQACPHVVLMLTLVQTAHSPRLLRPTLMGTA